MRARALLLPALLLSLLPAGGASACHGGDQYVETLTVALPAPPAAVRAGGTARVTAAVTRAAAPAGEVDVLLRLRYGSAPEQTTYDSGRTGADGRTELVVPVPRDARGPLEVSVEAFSPLLTVPCYGTVTEHGAVRAPWGRVAR